MSSARALGLAGIGLVLVACSGSGPAKGHATTTAAASTSSSQPATTTSSATPQPLKPVNFTVHVSCAGKQCTLAVRDGPGTTGRLQVRVVNDGQTVQIDCYTVGEMVADRDTGRQSDVWLRYSGTTNNFSSALYLQGPTVPKCP